VVSSSVAATTVLERYFGLHAANLVGAAGRLARQPIASLLTILVIAIALALPAGLRVFLDNVTALTGNWQSAADITVYMSLDTAAEEAQTLAARIGERPDVAATRLIPSEQALAEFRERSGFGEALEALSGNPLPHTIVVSPAGGTSADPGPLRAALADEAGVDLVQVDTEWVARLQALLALAGRIANIAAALLAAAVVLVIGNTIRLEINNRRVEIEVMKLVGGTDGFIRRPFLYLGLWYGGAGAVFAWLLIMIALLLLGGPVDELAALYSSDFRLSGLSARDSLTLLGGGAGLGWLGAWLAAARHLRSIEPA
jgi:cell division transport system permease protein